MPAQEGYYSQGNTDIATETPVTLKRLEPRRQLTKNSTRLVIALVGLPARGKSFVARKLLQYLQWSGCKCKIFNVGRYRREAYAMQLATHQDLSDRQRTGACDANFFDAHNSAASELREKVAELALLDMLSWLDNEDEDSDEENGSMILNDLSKHSSVSSLGGSARLTFQADERVAIFDATNSTDKRRKWLLDRCTRREKPTGVVFVESICDDQELLEENYRYKVSSSPDFAGMPQDVALADLRARVKKYEEQYETVEDDSISYIKVFNLSTKVWVNHIYGRCANLIVPGIMAWHIGTRPVFLCRPGQTISGILTDGEDYVAKNKIDTKDPRFLDWSTRTRRKNFRGDGLGHTGRQFQQDLLDFCYDESHSFMFKRASVRDMAYTGTSLTGQAESDAWVINESGEDPDHRDPFPLRILTSTMPRAIETVYWDDFEFKINQMSNLNPLDKGDFAGMELEEIRKVNPGFYEKLQQNAFGTRFPGGESYRDLIRRLVPVVIDIEQQVIPTLVVSHVSILQSLIAYFRNTPIEKCMSIEVPLHTVIKFTPVRGGGWSESRHSLHDTGGLPPMPPVDSIGELSAMSMHSASDSPIWGDHMTSAARRLMKEQITS